MQENFLTLVNLTKQSFKLQCLLSFIAGLVLVFAYSPLGFWPISIIVPAFWLTLVTEKTTKEATKLGFFFGLGWFCAGISWVHISIEKFGGMPLIISLLLVLILCVYLAIYPAIACYLASRLSKKRQFNPWLLPPAWLVSEYLRSSILTGFPWLSLGYSQIDSPLAVFAPVIGEIGITLIMLILAVCLSQLFLRKKNTRHTLILVLLSFTTWLLSQPTWLTLQNKSIKVALIQGNIKQELRWQKQQEWPTMLKYLDLTRENYDADLIIWPESAVPEIEAIAQDYLATVDRSAKLNNSSIITGIINYNFDSKEYFNSLIVLGGSNADNNKATLTPQYYYNNHNRYYKHHLLPIGEFVPFQSWLRPLAPFFNLPMSSFSRGDYVQTNLSAQGLNILPLICFEVVFAEQLSANFHDNTNLMLTVSNDAWFGDSYEPHQHLEISRMRALEFGRPMLRSTNNGVSAVIDHQGKVIKQIAQFKEGVLKTNVNLVTGRTPYSQWGKWPSYVLALIIFIAIRIKEKS